MKSEPRHFTTHRPVAVLMVFMAAVVFGYFSYKRLPLMLMPEMSYPTLTVRTEYPGAAPEEVENDVSRPVEEALGVVSGLHRISSISRAGVSDVVLEFVWGTKMSDATQNTLEKLELVFLPREAEKPLLLQFDPALDPIMELSFSGEGERFEEEPGLRRLRRIAELQIKRALEPIQGVAAVRIRGGLEEEIHVLLDERQLLRTGLSIQNVIERLRQENINVAGGNVKEGRAEYMVRTINEFQTVEEIGNTIIKRQEGRDIRVRDLGQVVRTHKEREIITRTEGGESVQIDIYKEADANMVHVAKEVISRIGSIQEATNQVSMAGFINRGGELKKDGLAAQLWREEGAKLQVVADRSVFIENSIREVRDNAIFGGLLAIIILFFFLGDVKTTSIIAISIPVGLILSFAPLNLFGVSLNIMSLGGLALGVGMLVDCSIVVLESIFRCRDEGDSVIQAAIRGTNEVRGAVISSTLTSVAVFLPMVFVEGIAGQAFGDLGLAVVVSQFAALIVALFLLPMLASRQRLKLAGSKDPVKKWRHFGSMDTFREQLRLKPVWLRTLLLPYAVVRLIIGLVLEVIGKIVLLLCTGVFMLIGRIAFPAARAALGWAARYPLAGSARAIRSLQASYPNVLRACLRNPAPVLLVAAASFYLIWAIGSRLGSELLPEMHQGEFTFELGLPVGTPLERTDAVLSDLEKEVLQEFEQIDSLLVTYGYDATNMKRSDEGEHSARFKVLLKPSVDPARTEKEVMGRLRARFGEVPDLEFRSVKPVLFSAKTPIVVEVHGDDLTLLKAKAQEAEAVMRGIPALADVETTLRPGAPELQIAYDRDRLMRYNLNIGQVAQRVRDMVKGFEASRFNLKDRRIPIIVRLAEEDRDRTEDVGRLVINAGTNNPIPLNAIAKLTLEEGPSEIRRLDGRRAALVQANIASGSLGDAVGQIRAALGTEMEWPAGMTFLVTGQSEEWERSQRSLFLALALSVFLVYVIMAAQFESLSQPFIIMFTIPLAFVGSAIGLKLLGVSLSVVVFLGMITLVGIVVNNAIVLVDYTNTLRSRGLPLMEAITTAGQVRLRPILMTTATTVLGLIPMALGLGEGAEIRSPMALTIVFGLTTSTILTLLVIPTIYYLFERGKEKLMDPTEQEEVESARPVIEEEALPSPS